MVFILSGVTIFVMTYAMAWFILDLFYGWYLFDMSMSGDLRIWFILHILHMMDISVHVITWYFIRIW